MEDPLLSLVNIVLVLFLVLLNGFFVAAEFAIVSCKRTKLNSKEHKNKFGWKQAIGLSDDLELSLSSTQFGITIASLVLGWWGEQSLANIFLHLFEHIPENFRYIVSHGLATTFALIIVTFLHVVLGELAAKSVAIRYPEITLRILAPSLHFFTKVCKPILWFLNWSANGFLSIFGLTAVAESERVHTSSELAMLVAHSTERGELDKDEEEMLKGVFSFSDTVAREVMTPRTDMVVISLSATLDEVISKLVSSGFSRLPVKGDTVDNIVGILLARDIFPYVQSQLSGSGEQKFEIKKIMREPYFIPETKPVDDLLNELKGRKVHMAVVLDEHGGVDGVVTLEDLVEEIFGEIFDESDIAEDDIVFERNGDMILDASILVSDLNSEFKLSIPEGDYDTLSGFMFTLLGRVPEVGDQIAIFKGSKLLVNGVDPNLEPDSNLTSPKPEVNGVEKKASLPLAKEAKPIVILVVEEMANNRIEHVRLIRSSSSKKPETTLGDSSSKIGGQKLQNERKH